jgi:hypothetical protein
MIKPKFPYTGNQVIVSSDRVMLHSKTDGVFIMGYGTVGLSSRGSINIDTKELVVLSSPKIYLGFSAKQRVILGDSMIKDLKEVFVAMKNMCDSLAKINETNFAASLPTIRFFSNDLSKKLNDKIISIENNLSNVTYTE